VAALNRDAAARYAQGRYDEALRLQEQALTLCRRLYPKAQYPDGHPDLALSLNNLGGLLDARGEYAGAEPFYRDALAMNRTLYPRAQYPAGHPDLALSLNNLGGLLDARGEYAGLAGRLPQDAAFIDLHRYQHREKGAKKWRPHYVAFVLRRGRPVRRVELGRAEPVEKALAAWRQAIAQGRDSPAAADLRRLVWDKLAGHLPEKAGSTVYLCPDGGLSGLPWAALPGRAQGTVLLEDHALALVPHGPFLLERLRPREERGASGAGVLLAVGGVRYDQAADPVRRPADDLADARPADRGDRQGVWPALPGTAREAKQVAALARGLSRPPQVIDLTGTRAGPGQLLLELPEARWAHLATHGFFAAPASDVRQYLYDEKDFLRGPKGERVGAGARNPLTQTGLVLAGANLQGKAASPDGGILTAEALAGLDLGRLELAVLSACETGLGEAATGEGVFGLQRAFHLAGTRDVVASLWKVNDRATAALMALFYRNLWQEKLPPIEALRQAQLALYRHPEHIPAWARGERGPNLKAPRPPSTPEPAPPGERPAPGGRAPTKLWAAFVLSGPGQPSPAGPAPR
jgi:CHAT domain-containing protein